MKKFFVSVAVFATMGLLTLSQVSAQKAEVNAPVKDTEAVTPAGDAATTARPGFVDANNDGVCDNYDGQRPGKGLGPGNGQGEGRAKGKGLGRGKGLRDGSGQGFRDGSGQGLRDGSGRRSGQGRGQGQGLRDGSGPNCNPAPAK